MDELERFLRSEGIGFFASRMLRAGAALDAIYAAGEIRYPGYSPETIAQAVGIARRAIGAGMMASVPGHSIEAVAAMAPLVPTVESGRFRYTVTVRGQDGDIGFDGFRSFVFKSSGGLSYNEIMNRIREAIGPPGEYPGFAIDPDNFEFTVDRVLRG